MHTSTTVFTNTEAPGGSVADWLADAGPLGEAHHLSGVGGTSSERRFTAWRNNKKSINLPGVMKSLIESFLTILLMNHKSLTKDSVAEHPSPGVSWAVGWWWGSDGSTSA